MNNDYYYVEKNECYNNEVNDDNEVSETDYGTKLRYRRVRSLTPPRNYSSSNSSLGEINVLFLFIISFVLFMFPNFSFSLCVTLSLNVIYKQITYELNIENIILQIIGISIPFFILNNFAGIIIGNLILYYKNMLIF